MKHVLASFFAISALASIAWADLPSREDMFKWFDSATSSALTGNSYIDYYPTGGKYSNVFRVRGLILAETSDAYLIRMVNLGIGWFAKEPAPGHAAPSNDVRKAVDDVQQDLDQPSLSGDDIQGEFDLFVLARIAALIGQDQLSERVWRASYAVAERSGRLRKRSYQLVIRNETEERFYYSLLDDDLTDPNVPRSQVAARFRKFGRGFSKGRYGPKALQIANDLDAPSSLTKIDFYDLPPEQAGLYWSLILRLREFTAGNPRIVGVGYPVSNPFTSQGDVFDSHAKWGPSPEILSLGYGAIDPLIRGLNCYDLSRVPSGSFEYPIMSVGDLCERLLEMIAQRVFLDHEVSSTPNQDRRFAMIARQRIERWRVGVLMAQLMSGLR